MIEILELKSSRNQQVQYDQVILSCNELTDDELIVKLRSCFSHAPIMNEAREELRGMRQLEHESVSVYIYKWGRSLYRSSGICSENERHPHVIKDFIFSLKKYIRNKFANKWAEMRQPPNTVGKRLSNWRVNIEKQLQVADSFKLKFSSYPTVEINEMSTEESSGDEFEINEVSRGKKWGNNNNYNQKHSNFRITVATTAADPNNTNLRTADKASSGDKSQKTPRSLRPRSQLTMCLLNSAAASLNSLTWQLS